jgi:class 3 adenylate cyclase
MLVLAERLREQNGGFLDDSAIQAVAEATGTPVEYVRLAAKIRNEKIRHSLLAKVHGQYLQLEPHTRRFVIGGLAATMCALFAAAGDRAAVMQSVKGADIASAAFAENILNIVALLWLTLGLYNACVSRDARTGAAVGSIFAAGVFVSYELFGFVLHLPLSDALDAPMILPAVLGGALGGLLLQKITDKYRSRLGLRDPVRERQELLRQLTSLQERLNSDRQEATFLSVDIVGSTRMKEKADAFAVEYTFNEYHHFVERITKKHGGSVHSTAGDGVTCAFEEARQAFTAAKNIAAGLLELNTLRNKIGIPIQLRQGIHTGMVMAPDGDDITSVNFAHVIDIAAHLQKIAPPGSIVVSDAAATYLGGPSSIGSEKVNASGVGGTIWDAKQAPVQPAPGGPPPVPKPV